MASPIALRRWLLGSEATPGEAAPMRRRIYGTGEVTKEITVASPSIDFGEFDMRLNHAPGVIMATGSFEQPLYMDQITDFLLMGVNGDVTPTYSAPDNLKYSNDGSVSDLDDAKVPAGEETIATFVAAEDFIYVGDSDKFRAIIFALGDTVQSNASTVTVEVSDGASGWIAATLDVDTTLSGGDSLGRSGGIEFVPPSGWAADTVDSVVNKFWVRLSWSADWSASVDIAEVEVAPEVCEWDFTPGNDLKAYSVEYFEGFRRWIMVNSLVDTLSINGAVSGEITVASDFVAKDRADLTTVAEPIQTNPHPTQGWETEFYIDDLGGTPGTTGVSGTLLEFEISLMNQIARDYRADNTQETHGFTRGRRYVDSTVVLEFNSKSYVEYENFLGENKRMVHLALGQNKTIDGNATERLTLTLPGDWVGSVIQESEATTTIELTHENEFVAGQGYAFNVSVRNSRGVGS